MLVLVGEIAPQRVVRVQTANRLEGERLDAPGLERLVIVTGTFRVYLHAVAKLARMFVKRGFEPALAQAATIEPARGKDLHFHHDCPRIDIGSAELFERPSGAAPFRERRALEHHRPRIGARHPQVRCVGTGIDPRARAQRPAEPRRGIGLPILHLDDPVIDIELERPDKPQTQLAEREPMTHWQRSCADKAFPAGAQRQTFERPTHRIGPI